MRNVNYDFSAYISRHESYENSKGETVWRERYGSSALVTDSYVLQNTTGEDQTLRMLYPFTGDMRAWEYYPSIPAVSKVPGAPMRPARDSRR